MMKSLAIAAAVLALFAPLAAWAQPAPLDAAAKREAVAAAATQLRDRYVFPDVGAKAAERIEAQLAAGAYDGLDSEAAFAQRLTTDLREVTNDKHVRVNPRAAPPPPPPAGAAPAPAPVASEGGVARADRMPGGVGYIELVNFPAPADFKPAIDRAMAAVADAPALIIDNRRNGGGSAVSVAYLESFFQSGDKPVHLLTFHNRVQGSTRMVSAPVMSVATPTKFLGKPVYILTSAGTFSGGEGFAYNMQAMKLAKTVGETTGGGANPGGVVPIGPRFGMFVPNGRPESPITHTNWEGVGVIPDIASPAPEALRVALEKLGQKPAGVRVDELSQARLFEPQRPVMRTVALPGTEAAVRQIVADLISAQPHYEAMTPTMAEITKAQLTQLNKAVTDLGPLKSIVFKEGDARGADSYDVAFDRGVLRFRISLDPAGKIAGVNFRPVN